jgi:uncharacterized membrane protein
MGPLYLLWVFTGLILIGVSIPLVLKKIPPNQWYGFRVPKTFSSDRIWYEANRVAGIDLCLAGGAVIGASVVMNFIAPMVGEGISVTVMLIVIIVSLLAAIVHSLLALRKM